MSSSKKQFSVTFTIDEHFYNYINKRFPRDRSYWIRNILEKEKKQYELKQKEINQQKELESVDNKTSSIL